MAESLRQRLDFPSPIIKAQAVRDLVAAVLKEAPPSGQITQASPQSPALATVWQQCCSDCPLVRSACCDAVVLLVGQGHADLHYVLNSAQNLLPSASNVQGLLKVIGQLLQMQVDQRDTNSSSFTCPYSVRSCSHPYITVLENRADCWPALLLEIHHFIQQAVVRSEPVYISMLAPFLQYLYCAPQRQPQHALLRHNLLRVLVPSQSEAALLHQDPPCPVSAELLLCLCRLLPHAQVDSLEAVVELCGFLAALLPVLGSAAGEPWRTERTRLLLHLLCLCELCLSVGGDCRPVVGLMLQLLPSCQPELPLEELLMGITLLLLRAPVCQQGSVLSLALCLLPEHAELCPWLSPVLVLPVLQLLYCQDISEPLVDPKTHRQNRDLAHTLLLRISEKTSEAQQSGPHLLLPVSTWYHQLTLALSILRKVANSPAEAADWLLTVGSSLSSSQQGLCCLSLTVSHLLLTGEENICQLALGAAQAVAAAEPSQVRQHGSAGTALRST